MATRVFEGIALFKKESEKGGGRNISMKFHRNPISSLKKKLMQTDGRTDRQTDGRTHTRTHDGQQAMTYARWPLASGAKNLVDKQTFAINIRYANSMLWKDFPMRHR